MTQPVDPPRQVHVERTQQGRYVATNPRGMTLEFGHGEDLFSPVELLLAAIAGCSAIDVDFITSKRCQPDSFQVGVTAEKETDEHGGHKLSQVNVNFQLNFPDTEEGKLAEQIVERSIRQSRDRLCTVSRTVALPTTVTFQRDNQDVQ